jgi:hypothetical protein
VSICTNCGNENADVYCPQCGEKQPSHHDLAVGHFAHDAVHELVHLDSKLFTTLELLVTKPGRLTAEYFAGRKKRYIAPLRLFLTLFAIQFFAFTAWKPAAMYNIDKFAAFDKTGKLEAKMQSKAKMYGMTYEQYTERIDHRWQKNLSLLQLVNILGLAVVLKLLYVKRHRYMVEHLVFGSHYLSFAYLFNLLMVPVFIVTGFKPGPVQSAVGATSIVIHMIYLWFAQRRYYGVAAGQATWKTLVLYLGIYLVNVVLLTGSMLAALLQYG